MAKPKLDFSGKQQATTSIEELHVVDEILPISTIDASSFRHIRRKIPVKDFSGSPGKKSHRSEALRPSLNFEEKERKIHQFV